MKWLIILVLLFSACNVQDSVMEELDNANYCTVASDCVDIGSKCPFGCDILVNEKEADIMKKKLNALPDTRCVYGCVQYTEILCEENKCVKK